MVIICLLDIMQILALLCMSFHPTLTSKINEKKMVETSFYIYLNYRFDRHCHKRDHKIVFLLTHNDFNNAGNMLFEC